MKHKYRIWKNVKEKNLRIQEYAVLTAESRKQKLPGPEDEDFSLLCEQTYQADEVMKATSLGKDELILYLRNQHFFPIGIYMDLIADTISAMYAAKGEQHEDLVFDDKQILMGNRPELENADMAGIEEDSNSDDSVNDIDDLLDDDSPVHKNDPAESIKQEQLDEDKEY
jgi:hypothetical protein